MRRGRGEAKANDPGEKDGLAETEWRIKSFSEFSDFEKETSAVIVLLGVLCRPPKRPCGFEP